MKDGKHCKTFNWIHTYTVQDLTDLSFDDRRIHCSFTRKLERKKLLVHTFARYAAPKLKTSSLGGSTSHQPFPFCPQIPILGQEVLKIHANIYNAVSALHVRYRRNFSVLKEIAVEEHDGYGADTTFQRTYFHSVAINSGLR